MDKYLPYRNLNCEEEEYLDFSADIPDHFSFLKDRNIIRIELNDYNEFDLHVICRVPRKINEYLYEENHSDPGFLVSLNFSCIESNTRYSILLHHVRRYLFRGSIRIDPDITGSRFRLSVQISRKTHGDFSNRKFASRKGSLLAWSEPKEFWLEDPPLSEGTEIRGEWTDFEQNSNVPSSFRKELYFLDQTEKHPKIMMNSSMDRSLLNLIMYKGFGNPKSYLRESLFRFIALNVWTQLVDAGISEIREFRKGWKISLWPTSNPGKSKF